MLPWLKPLHNIFPLKSLPTHPSAEGGFPFRGLTKATERVIMKKQFDESKHKRDELGRFAKMSTSELKA